MADRTSAASTNDLEALDSPTVPAESGASSWYQAALFGLSDVVITPRLIISGAEGQMAVSIEVTEFWTGQTVASQVRPAMKFPAELNSALSWLEEQIRQFSASISPF
jgi:hypothetical protein